MAKVGTCRPRRKPRWFLPASVCLLFVCLLALPAASVPALISRFLLFSTDLCRVDAVILMVGPEFGDRYREADELIRRGYGEYLLIPAYLVAARSPAGINNPPANPEAWRLSPEVINGLKVRSYYEETHTELLYARAQMDRLGLKSAILVSSPYHMRRIGIISGRVFDSGRYRLYFIPARFGQTNISRWYMNWKDVRWISTEYTKIVWFYFYNAMLS